MLMVHGSNGFGELVAAMAYIRACLTFVSTCVTCKRWRNVSRPGRKCRGGLVSWTQWPARRPKASAGGANVRQQDAT
jgi:hypothetical protein